jgi:FtsZ-interacting cell division protein ZipA
MLILIGPAVALIGIVAVVFVMRHKSVEKRSMYSSRRSQIEHKVRAARQRTLAPVRRAEKANRHGSEEAESAPTPAPTLTYEASAYAAPPVAPPPKTGHTAPSQPVWGSEPKAPEPTPPPFAPAAPQYEPPAYEPPAAEPPAWSPTGQPARPAPQQREEPAAAASTSAGAGASWSVVGESKASAEPEPDTKKKQKGATQTGAWTLASGEVAGEEVEEGPKRPAAALAIAQYAVLVVGLVMVLIGVVVMVANSSGS